MNILLSTEITVVIIVVTVLFLLILFLILWWINIYRHIHSLQKTIRSSLNDIFIVMKERFALVEEKYRLCSQKMSGEESIKTDLADIKMKLDLNDLAAIQIDSYIDILRNLLISLKNIEEKISFVSGDTSKLNCCAELSDNAVKLVENEEYIQSTRRIYNGNASSYNRTIAMFPNSIVAHAIDAGTCDYIHVNGLTEENYIVK